MNRTMTNSTFLFFFFWYQVHCSYFSEYDGRVWYVLLMKVPCGYVTTKVSRKRQLVIFEGVTFVIITVTFTTNFQSSESRLHIPNSFHSKPTTFRFVQKWPFFPFHFTSSMPKFRAWSGVRHLKADLISSHLSISNPRRGWKLGFLM